MTVVVGDINSVPATININTVYGSNLFHNQIRSGQDVYVEVHGLYKCTSVMNCETGVNVGGINIPFNPSSAVNDSLIKFTAPQLNLGSYDLYIYNNATGAKSNVVKVSVI